MQWILMTLQTSLLLLKMRNTSFMYQYVSGFDQLLVEEIEAHQNYIAQELHDALGSRLTAISLMLSSHKNMLSSSPAQHQSLNNVMQHVQVALEVTRKLAHGLLTLDNSSGSLWRGLEAMCIDYNQIDGIDFKFNMVGDFDDIPAIIANHLYRIAQESMTNALRHANAQSVVVTLIQKGELREMSITDHGAGGRPISDSFASQHGLGVRSMHMRSQMMGATLHITQATSGTRVCVSWNQNIQN
jgi:signal transduction histidine kinase